MNFFLFLLGSLGCFTIGMIFFMTPLENGLSLILTQLLDQLGRVTQLFDVYKKNDILVMQVKDGIVSMMITYECSGIIEMLIYISLVSFFPFIKGYKKLLVGMGGALFIILANIIRITSIVIIVKIFGINSYAFAHTIIARILFFILMLILYYYVFTREQVKKQKVGGIR